MKEPGQPFSAIVCGRGRCRRVTLVREPAPQLAFSLAPTREVLPMLVRPQPAGLREVHNSAPAPADVEDEVDRLLEERLRPEPLEAT